MKTEEKNLKINSNLKKFHDLKYSQISYEDPALFYLLLEHLKKELDKEKLERGDYSNYTFCYGEKSQ